MGFRLKFWGVRGSIACPTPRHMVFGGNTSCVEVMAGERRIILDAGTGIRGLGQTFMKEDVRRGDLLLTHTHWDHINGFPFFGPAYRKDHTFRVMAGHLAYSGGIRATLAGQMADPMFPVPIEVMHAEMLFEDFKASDSFDLDANVHVRTAPLNHPNGATGYRIEYGGKAACYVTDTEHFPGKPDQNVLGLIDGADVVIYDCTYTDDEFPDRVGWGHSTWQEGVRLCRAAGAKALVIFHHDPDHEDDFMEKIEIEAHAAWSGASVAREGASIELL